MDAQEGPFYQNLFHDSRVRPPFTCTPPIADVPVVDGETDVRRQDFRFTCTAISLFVHD